MLGYLRGCCSGNAATEANDNIAKQAPNKSNPKHKHVRDSAAGDDCQ